MSMQGARHIAFFLLFAAVVMMVVNGVRPHHHHHYQVCFVSGHGDDEESCRADDNGRHGLEHQHGHPVNELCRINGLDLISKNNSASFKLVERSLQKTECLVAIFAEEPEGKKGMATTLMESFDPWHPLLAVTCLTQAFRAPPSC